MNLHADAQDRIEEAMKTVLGLEDEQKTYADTYVGDNTFVMIESDDSTVYVYVAFDDPPEVLPSSLTRIDDEMKDLVQMLERAYLRVQNRKTSFNFTLDQSARNPQYKVQRPLVVQD